MKKVVKTILENVAFLAIAALVDFAICYPIVWLMERYLPPHMWEALVDAFNRFFGG